MVNITNSIFAFSLLAGVALAGPVLARNGTPSDPSKRSVDFDSKVVDSAYAFFAGAGNFNNANYDDNNGRQGSDEYKCYYGAWTNFPDQSQWLDFDIMWNNSKSAMQHACTNHGLSPENTDAQIGQLWDSIQRVAQDSLLDHRFIHAVILQESTGCMVTPTTDNGVRNPGIMQSHAGASFVGPAASYTEQGESITQMVVDGVQGTAAGPGLVHGVNKYGNIYEAAREYNSGSVNQADLNAAVGATAGYVLDIANRMTGWMYANRGTSGACSICGIC